MDGRSPSNLAEQRRNARGEQAVALAATVGWNGHRRVLGTVERIFAALP